MGLEAGTKQCSYLCLGAVCIGDGKDTIHTIEGLTFEILYLSLTLYNQADSDTLYSSGREGRLDLTPQHWGELKAYQTVKDATSLLGVH